MSAFEYPFDDSGYDEIDLEREDIAELQDLDWAGKLVDPSLPAPLNSAPPVCVTDDDGALTIHERGDEMAAICAGPRSHINLEDAA